MNHLDAWKLIGTDILHFWLCVWPIVGTIIYCEFKSTAIGIDEFAMFAMLSAVIAQAYWVLK